MPPHCDAMDGPVVLAAARAIETDDVDLVLPYVHEDGEEEIRSTFARVMAARAAGGAAAEVADRYLFETVVRVHRAGEGAPFEGLKPAGLDHGPVIPVAERAIETGSSEELAHLLADEVAQEVKHRLDRVMELKASAPRGVPEARSYTQTMLGLQVWAHHLHLAVAAPAHGEHGE